MAWQDVNTEKGKKGPGVYIAELNGDELRAGDPHAYDSPERGPAVEDAWAPGSKVPWVAAAEIAIAVLCTVAAIVVVKLSDGKLQGSWHLPATKHGRLQTKRITIEPKLLLSVLSSVVSLMLGLALKEGLNVSWWRRVIVGGKVRDLERHWAMGNSVLKAAMAGRRMTYVACGLLLVTVTSIAESTLMQRSTTTKAQLVKPAAPFNITSQLATELPFTGWMDQNSGYPVSLDPGFASVVRAWTSNAPIDSNFIGCDGTCSAVVIGVGLVPECQSSKSKITVKGPDWHNGTNAAAYAHPVFAANFSSIMDDDLTIQNITLDVLSSTSFSNANGDCPRNLTWTSCTLQPAIVKYSVAISNRTLTLDQTVPLQVVRNITFHDRTSEEQSLYTSLGGITLALGRLYTSAATLQWANERGDGNIWASSGSLVDSYRYSGVSSANADGFSCNATFADPTEDLLHNINDLVFRIAVTNSNATDRAQVPAHHTGMLNYYRSSFPFLGAAIALVWLNIFVIVPLFWGWWDIGRKTSLNPVEVAEAFNAPILRADTGHRDVDGLMRHVGDRAIVFRPIEREVGTVDGTRVFRSMKIVTPEGG